MLGTLLGAGCGLAILQLPAITHTPAAMLACMAAGSIALGLVARAQARTGIVLGLLTLCAVSLCFYESVCCSPGPHMTPMDLFLARVASVSHVLSRPSGHCWRCRAVVCCVVIVVWGHLQLQCGRSLLYVVA